MLAQLVELSFRQSWTLLKMRDSPTFNSKSHWWQVVSLKKNSPSAFEWPKGAHLKTGCEWILVLCRDIHIISYPTFIEPWYDCSGSFEDLWANHGLVQIFLLIHSLPTPWSLSGFTGYIICSQFLFHTKIFTILVWNKKTRKFISNLIFTIQTQICL